MADKKVFTIEINGVKQSYDEVVKLRDVLNDIKDVTAKVSVEVDKNAVSNQNSAKASKEKVKALTDEEKAQKKLAETQEKAAKPISELEKEQAKANIQLKERAKELQNMAALETAAANSPAAMKAELASLNAEWNKTEEGTERFKELTDQIDALNARLKESEFAKGTFGRNVGNYPQQLDAVNSSLESLSTGIEQTSNSAKGMFNVFQAGVGIALIFDDSNTELGKTLNQLGKIMAIVSALQKANNALLVKGTAISKGAAVMEGIHAIQVRARATAISLSTKNTIAATIAQAAFNVVAKANPYVLLAMALITVIGALTAFIIGTSDAAEKQALLNEKVSESIGLKETYVSVLKRMSEASISELQRELDLMKARGASEAQLAQKQRQIYEERLKYAKKNSANHEKEISEINLHAEKVKELTRTINDRNAKLLKGEYKNNEAFKKTNETLEARLKIHNELLNIGLQAQEEEKKAISDLDKFNAETAKKGLELGKKNALALAEYRVLMAQKGSKEELIAQIAAANQRLKNDLNNVDITKGERLKRTKETLLEIEKLESDYRKAQLQDNIALIDAGLSLAKQGSLEEYNLNISRLIEQKKIDLENKDLTANQKLQIENKYLSDVKKLTDDYVKTISENEINASISTINARLVFVKAGTQEELNLRIDLAKENARLAKENIENTIQDETLKAAKIKEINENLRKDIRELSSGSELSQIERTANKETLLIEQQYADRLISRRNFEEQKLKIAIDAIKKEIAFRKAMGEDTTELESKLANAIIAIREAEQETLQAYVDQIMTSINAIFDATNSVLQAQLDDANAKFDAISEKYDQVVEKREESDSRLQELEEQAKNARGGRALILQEQINAEMQANQELANQERQLAKEKEKQEAEIAKREKQMKKAELSQNIIQGMANTALGVTKALEWGFPLGPIFAAIIGAAGAIQIGVMTSQLAKLEDGGLLKGKRHSNGGMRIEGTNIEVEGGEYVINRESTDKNLGLVKYINSQRRALGYNDLSSFFSKTSQGFEPPFRRHFEIGGQLPNVAGSSGIDYGLMASAMKDSMKEVKFEPKVAVTDINQAQDDAVRVDNWAGL